MFHQANNNIDIAKEDRRYHEQKERKGFRSFQLTAGITVMKRNVNKNWQEGYIATIWEIGTARDKIIEYLAAIKNASIGMMLKLIHKRLLSPYLNCQAQSTDILLKSYTVPISCPFRRSSIEPTRAVRTAHLIQPSTQTLHWISSQQGMLQSNESLIQNSLKKTC